MILVIDTSSFRSAVGIVESGRGRILEESSQRPDLARLYRDELANKHLTKVAVATGPGSFTGLRVGVSFSLGLAIGLRIPIVPLPTLDLQAARSDEAVIAVSEAGRGRVYFQMPGGRPRLGEPTDLPTSHRLVGWVAPRTEAALTATRHAFRPEDELRNHAEAAARLLETAREVAYGSLEIEYMQSFSAR